MNVHTQIAPIPVLILAEQMVRVVFVKNVSLHIHVIYVTVLLIFREILIRVGMQIVFVLQIVINST